MTQTVPTRPDTTSGQTLATMGPLEWAMLLALSLLWGGSFYFVGVAVTGSPTLSIVTMRVGLAAAALWAVIAALPRPIPRSPAVWGAFFGMGLLNNAIPFSLIVWGQQSIGSGLASILNATTPLFTVVVAGSLLAGERITRLKITGVAIGFLGVAVMIGPGALSGAGRDGLAQAAVLGAALSYACAGAFGRRLRRMRVDPMVTAAGQVTASTILLTPLALAVDRPWTLPAPDGGVWASVVALAVFSTALAYVLYFCILSQAGATNMSLVTFLVPVSAIMLGVLRLGERLEPGQIAGMALIGAGLAVIDGRLFR